MAVIPIVFTFDKRIILAASAAIKSLIESANSDTIYDIKILHNDINNKIQENLTKLLENTKHSMSFYWIDNKIFKGLKKSRNSWSEVVYYRLYIPEIINYDKVIYSDVDVYFKKDLSEVYSTDISNYEVGAVKAELNTKESVCHRHFEENKNEFTYWSGFLLMNCKKLKEENFFEKFMDTARKHKEKLKFFDLDVLNITCNNIKELPLNYCVLEAIYEFEDYAIVKDYRYLSKIYSDEEFIDAKNNPAIIHYAGELGKPWRRKKIPEYYKKTIKSLPKKLRIYRFRDIRKRFFSKK